MRLFKFCRTLFILLILGYPVLASSGNDFAREFIINQKIPIANQLLYNGKIWENTYFKIKGNAYFLSGEFLSGSVSFNGKLYSDLNIKYDIFRDEILISANSQTIIILNKEMVDSLSIDYQSKSYSIINMGDDPGNVLKGYVNVLYRGSSTLFVKYQKEISILGYEKIYDLFYQTHNIYLEMDGKISPVSGKRAFFISLGDRKAKVKDYLKRNNLKVVKSDPESFIPALQFYDSIIQ